MGRSFCVHTGRGGIPAYSVSREGYFETYEVSVLLDYLKVLDNARQDLPLTAVLTSPFAGLTAAELSVIRLGISESIVLRGSGRILQPEFGRKFRKLWTKKQANTGTGKIEEVFRGIGSFQEILPYTAIHDLLAEIIDKTGYRLFISAMPGGAQRQANVENVC